MHSKKYQIQNLLGFMIATLLTMGIATQAQADQPAREEQTAWQQVLATEDVQTIQNYLSKYPKGSYVSAAQQKLAAALKVKTEREKNGVIKDCADCPEMVTIPAGSFNMGSNSGVSNEKPIRHVTISYSFALGKTEVTQAQWRAIMGDNPSSFKNCGDQCPVENISWNDAQKFIQQLNAKTGKQYRLPSEAEWEYACRAGDKHEYCGSDNVGSVAWYGAYANPAGNSKKTTHPVATKDANAWGFYDMSGNVWEWVDDSWHDNFNGAPVDGSSWQGDGAMRVLRGGAWNHGPGYVRVAVRSRIVPTFRFLNYGFRLARTIPLRIKPKE